jgi:hypothetical protein
MRLPATRETGDNNPISRLPGFRGDADCPKLPAIVDLKPPRLWFLRRIPDVDHQERMWVDEAKFRDDTFDYHLAAGVVDRGDRMMGVDDRTGAGKGNGNGE